MVLELPQRNAFVEHDVNLFQTSSSAFWNVEVDEPERGKRGAAVDETDLPFQGRIRSVEEVGDGEVDKEVE